MQTLQFNQGSTPAAASTTPAGQPAAQEQATGAPAVPVTPTTPAVPAAPAVPVEQPLTEGRLQAILDERDRRNRQSAGDQATAAVQKEIARWAKAGIVVTPEQAQAVLAGDTPTPATQPATSSAQPSTAAPAQAQRGSGEPEAPVVTEVRQMIANAGLTMDDSPEWDMIDQETDNPLVFKASAAKAVAAILEREASEGKASHVPGLTGGQHTNVVPHAKMSGTETLNSYYDDFLAQHHR